MKENAEQKTSESPKVRKVREFKPWLVYFFWWCSGAHLSLLKDIPSEKNKFFGIGGAVFATWIMASVSGSYAFYTTFDHVLFSVFFGFIWGLVIFNFDRYIVATMRKKASGTDVKSRFKAFGNELLPALPRLVLAALIGLTVSKPLELKLFENEIARELASIRTIEQQETQRNLGKVYEVQLLEINKEIDLLEKKLEQNRSHVNQLRQKFLDELDGNPQTGSGRAGYSTIARIKEREFLAADSALKNQEQTSLPRLQTLRTDREVIQERQQIQLDEFEEIKPGFLARIKALSDLTSKEKAIWWTSSFITFLIILIETGPVLVKLLAPRGPYDARLELLENMQLWEAEKRNELSKEIIEHSFSIKTQKEKNIHEKQIAFLSEVREQKISSQIQKWRDGDLQIPFEELNKTINLDFHPQNGNF